MNLFEYIKSQLPKVPNASIMKNMGASDELVEYVKKTPWNTNLGILSIYGCEPSKEGIDPVEEIWFMGTVDPSQECVDGKYRDFYATSTDYADLDAITANPANYSIKINDIVLPYFRDNTSLNSLVWSNEENDEDVTASFSIVYGNIFGGTVPCDITGDIKIYVTKK